jgi:hypothetical protein
MDPEAINNIIKDTKMKRVRPLENHPNPSSQLKQSVSGS